MTAATYYIKTNHLPRYAAAVALEILLRGYHLLMGRFDPEDVMFDVDCTTLRDIATSRIESMRSLLKSYAESWLNLAESKLR
jgi:hypothetical protein